VPIFAVSQIFCATPELTRENEVVRNCAIEGAEVSFKTTHVPKTVARPRPALRDGTPVSLFSVEDLRSATTETAKPVTFVLSKDVEAGSVIAAKAGSKVVGQVTYTAAQSAAGAVDSIHLSLENVHLKIGETDVPLRSTSQKAGARVVEYHWLEDTGRIALVLYVAGDVTLAQAR
jgi:hypothetical protein